MTPKYALAWLVCALVGGMFAASSCFRAGDAAASGGSRFRDSERFVDSTYHVACYVYRLGGIGGIACVALDSANTHALGGVR